MHHAKEEQRDKDGDMLSNSLHIYKGRTGYLRGRCIQAMKGHSALLLLSFEGGWYLVRVYSLEHNMLN